LLVGVHQDQRVTLALEAQVVTENLLHKLWRLAHTQSLLALVGQEEVLKEATGL
jgi:hypothetical protein